MMDLKIKWIRDKLQQRIAQAKWPQVIEELARFVRTKDLQVVKTWTTDFVQSRIERIEVLE